MKAILTALLFTTLITICSAFLYFKTEVSKLETDIAALDKNIEENKMAIHVLNAEWAHLNEPHRIRMLVQKHISLKEVSAEQIKGFDIFSAKTKSNIKKVSY